MAETTLTDERLAELERDYFLSGSLDDRDVGLLLAALRTHREVLKVLFSFWRREPMRLIYFADSVRRPTMEDLKRRVAMEDV